MLLPVILALAVSLQPVLPSLTVEQARAMTTLELANAVLGPGHSPVVQVVVGSQGMEPPDFPGEPVRLKLYFPARPSDQHGFCEKIGVTVYLPPATPREGRSPSPAPVSEVRYRFVGSEASSPVACEESEGAFIPVGSAAEFEMVRKLYAAQQRARAARRLDFPTTVTDRTHSADEGPCLRALNVCFPITIYSDPLQAFLELPLTNLQAVHTGVADWPEGLMSAEHGFQSRENVRSQFYILAGSEWSVGVELSNGQITRARIIREYPPPF